MLILASVLQKKLPPSLSTMGKLAFPLILTDSRSRRIAELGAGATITSFFTTHGTHLEYAYSYTIMLTWT
jgi:hypothetical protein